MLQKFVIPDFVGELGFPCGYRHRIALDKRRFPCVPYCAAMMVFQRHKQRVIFQPIFLLLAKCLKLLPLLVRRDFLKVAIRGFEQTGFAFNHRAVIHAMLIEGRVLCFIFRKPARFDKLF
ncbi:hypothetical protein U14_00037 [Candidatus Moduliflexus flocculans]|uniref:Uncharacterized protein n=1 Tax=Candidatus Moduliflexus flocculans TaxID=1499966 RepID=A0A0S6VP88_9BACT|nr:hypothetical protein U14_00037 [Candidatus Moduliflexus flocculans]